LNWPVGVAQTVDVDVVAVVVVDMVHMAQYEAMLEEPQLEQLAEAVVVEIDVTVARVVAVWVTVAVAVAVAVVATVAVIV